MTTRHRFPRPSGKAKTHYIPLYIVDINSARRLHDNWGRGIINYLKYINSDLIYGDYVILEYQYILTEKKGIYIYDDNDLISYQYYPDVCSDLIIPKKFTIITNKIPIDYWQNSETGNSNYVWFNISRHKINLLDNIKYGELPNSILYGIYTTFMFFGIKYYIIVNIPNKFKNFAKNGFTIKAIELIKKKFYDIIRSTQIISLYLISKIYVNIEALDISSQPDTILFLNIPDLDGIQLN